MATADQELAPPCSSEELRFEPAGRQAHTLRRQQAGCLPWSALFSLSTNSERRKERGEHEAAANHKTEIGGRRLGCRM